jgi:hypothetical protein
LAPPNNAAGVILPPLPNNPATLADIANTKAYVESAKVAEFFGSGGKITPGALLGGAKAAIELI